MKQTYFNDYSSEYFELTKDPQYELNSSENSFKTGLSLTEFNKVSRKIRSNLKLSSDEGSIKGFVQTPKLKYNTVVM